MFDFKIPVGVIPDNITSDLQNMTSLQEAVDNILDLGNKDGGWNISGWTKRGTSADAALEQSATSYKPAIKQTVGAGKLGYHSQCPIVPAWRSDRIKSELVYLLYVSTYLRSYPVTPPQSTIECEQRMCDKR
jgi:hypothetical protein